MLTWAGYLHALSARDLCAIRRHVIYLVVFPSVIAVLAWNSGICKVPYDFKAEFAKAQHVPKEEFGF